MHRDVIETKAPADAPRKNRVPALLSAMCWLFMCTINPKVYRGRIVAPIELVESALWVRDPNIDSIPIVEIGQRRATTISKAGSGSIWNPNVFCGKLHVVNIYVLIRAVARIDNVRKPLMA